MLADGYTPCKKTCAGVRMINTGDPNLTLNRVEGVSLKFTRISVDAYQMGGVPCIRGLRIPVSTIVGMVADEMTEAEILRAFPDLEREDIYEALYYAAEAVLERQLPLLTPP